MDPFKQALNRARGICDRASLDKDTYQAIDAVIDCLEAIWMEAAGITQPIKTTPMGMMTAEQLIAAASKGAGKDKPKDPALLEKTAAAQDPKDRTYL